MGWDALFDFLGAGGGLLILLRWLSGVPWRRLELKKEREKTYRDLLDGDLEQIKELRNEIFQLQEQVQAQDQRMALMVRCPSYNRCPVRHLVQDYKRKYYYPPSGQPRMGQKGQRYPRDNPTKPSNTPDPDGQPP